MSNNMIIVRRHRRQAKHIACLCFKSTTELTKREIQLIFAQANRLDRAMRQTKAA